MSGSVPVDNPDEITTHLREASVIHVESLTIQADSVTVGEKKKVPTEDVARRHRWNAILLVLLTVLIVLWFQRHLQSWATEKLIFGSATVWALVQLARSATGKDLEDDAEKLRTRILAKEGTAENLVFALIGVVALLALTSSIYLKLGDGKQPRVRIDVLDKDGNLFMDSIVAERSSRIDGSLFVPRFKTRELTVVVREPANYRYLGNPITLKPWSAVDLTFGDETQFAPISLHALRVVPGWSLNAIDDPGTPEYVAVVTVGKQSFTIDHFKFQTLYLGVKDKSSLDRIVKEQTVDVFAGEINQHLQQHPGATEVAEYITDWLAAPRIEAKGSFSTGQDVTVSISIKGQQVPAAQSEPMKIGAGEITTVFVERKP
mgnify:CR=1 FL=1